MSASSAEEADFKGYTADSLLTPEERNIRFVGKTAAIVVLGLFTIFGGCSMHGHVYEADNMEAEAKIKALEVEALKAEEQRKVERIKAMERMVSNGANPIAVRCMDEGFRGDNSVCMAVGIAIGKINPEDVE